MHGPGQRSRYRDSLRIGRSGDRIPLGARLSAFLQTGAGAHPDSWAMGTSSLSGLKRPERDVNHPPTHYLPQRLNKMYSFILSHLRPRGRLQDERHPYFAFTVNVYFTILVTFGTGDLNVVLLTICEFCENWHTEGGTFSWAKTTSHHIYVCTTKT
jgi:hypothetical protein